MGKKLSANRTDQVSRVGDMGEPYKLQLTREDDGDIIVSILPIGHKWSDVAVQFCCGPGGGTQSHRTGLALSKLFEAMQADMAESLGRFVAEPDDRDDDDELEQMLMDRDMGG